jgi:glutathione S-transferase
VLEDENGRVLRESLVLLRYLEDRFPGRRIGEQDPYRRALEAMLIAMEREFAAQGYLFLMNQDPARRDALRTRMLEQYAGLNEFLAQHAPSGAFLFERFGLAECVFTPLFMRFWLLEYYEDFDLPAEGAYARVRAWRDACLAHPAAQQVSHEQIVKLYYDYAKGAGNGALLPGRSRSSFIPEPDWRARPWPPRDKYGHSASDQELGLSARRP